MIHMEYQQKMRRCHEYAEALEEEKRKIQVFQRELPLCLELVSQAIEACRRELSGSLMAAHTAAQPEECSEQTTSGGPVFEEFIPTKRSDSFDDGDDQEESTEHKTSDSKKKSDWLRSVQLWNNHESPDPADDEDSGKNGCAAEVKRNGGAFHPFQKDRAGDKSNQSMAPVKATASVLASIPASATSSSAETESKGGEKKEEKEGQTPRKHRRCWSPELHRRFLHALQQLGGSHVATPKQIRELMKVDGLTNDEVKSHLQKYRLHTRRPSVAIHNNGNPQVPQFVVVGGGIWVPPPAEYATMTATTGSGDAGSPATVYAPVATLAQPCKPMVQRPKPTRSNDRGTGMSHSTDGAARSSSPAGSSSTRTTTASPYL